jgi:hypothetical protein
MWSGQFWKESTGGGKDWKGKLENRSLKLFNAIILLAKGAEHNFGTTSIVKAWDWSRKTSFVALYNQEEINKACEENIKSKRK